MLYPLNLNLQGSSCVIIGGGKVAQRKLKTLLKAGAVVTVVAPQITTEIAELVKKQLLTWQSASYSVGMLSELKPLLVFCAADNAAVNDMAAQEAKAIGALVNVATRSAQADFYVPAHLERGNLLFTVATSGDSPAVARLLRQQLAMEYPPHFADFLESMTALRQKIKARGGDSNDHQLFWRQALSPRIIDLVRAGKLKEAEDEVTNGFIDARVES